MPLDDANWLDEADWWEWDVPLDPADDGGFGDSSEPDPETPRTGPDVRSLPFGLDKLDADGDTQVSLFEWRTGFEARGVPPADATATYLLLDLNNNGFLTRAEFDTAIGTGKAAADLTAEQTTALASLTALLNTAAGGNTPAGQVATLPPHADDPKPVAGGGAMPGVIGAAPGAGLTAEQQQLAADYKEWNSRYLRQTFLRVSAGGGNQGAWAGVAAGNPAFADATATDRAELTRIAVDLQTWNVTPETPPADDRSLL